MLWTPTSEFARQMSRETARGTYFGPSILLWINATRFARVTFRARLVPKQSPAHTLHNTTRVWEFRALGKSDELWVKSVRRSPQIPGKGHKPAPAIADARARARGNCFFSLSPAIRGGKVPTKSRSTRFLRRMGVVWFDSHQYRNERSRRTTTCARLHKKHDDAAKPCLRSGVDNCSWRRAARGASRARRRGLSARVSRP